MNATYALGTALSTPAGFMLMAKYDAAERETNVAKMALEQADKRPSRKRESVLERVNVAYGKECAYRDSMALMVVEASGYTVTRNKAIRAINEELDAMGEACWLAPIGRVKMLAMTNKLCSITN